MGTRLNEKELQALGFAKSANNVKVSVNASERVEYCGRPIGTPIEFTRNGKHMLGVIGTPTDDGRETAVYTDGDTWGALLLFAKHNAQIVNGEKAERAKHNGREYCKRELSSLSWWDFADEYSYDDFKRDIAVVEAALG